MRILCVNSGSSSLKLAIYEVGAAAETRLEGVTFGAIATPESYCQLDGKEREPCPITTQHEALELAMQRLSADEVDAVGHRVVHGGPRSSPEVVDRRLREALEDLIPLAPLHMPPALSAIDYVTARWPARPQVACFDTAFHTRLPELARRFPLPDRYFRDGVRRYGFHGLSYEYLVSRLGERIAGRCILAHLGNGASLVALKDGIPHDTTMGLTPMGGVMMGTRSGDLDPGVLIHLMRHGGFNADGLERLLERESGLLGVSGLTADMGELLSRASDCSSAQMAIELFCRSVSKAIGALAVVIGGLDRLVFTAGIGENADSIRRWICSPLGHLGVAIDGQRNRHGEGCISAASSACVVEVLHTDEDAMIAHHTASLTQR